MPGLPERLSLVRSDEPCRRATSRCSTLSRRVRDVHLFLLHPSPELWERVSELSPATTLRTRRRDDPSAGATRNPLLASWGRDSREMQLVLLVGGRRAMGRRPPWCRDGVRDWCSSASRPTSAPIGHLSGIPLPGDEDTRAVLADGGPEHPGPLVPRTGPPGRGPAPRDPAPVRDHPDLEPRDVLVMCPDIETYAPLIHAAFDSHPDEPTTTRTTPTIPTCGCGWQTGRSVRSTRFSGSSRRLLDMAGGRVTATEVLDLAGASRSGAISVSTTTTSHGSRSGWSLRVSGGGSTPTHRVAVPAGRARGQHLAGGLDRILVGVPMAEERQRLFGGVLPLDDVASADIELAGSLAELVDRIEPATDGLCGSSDRRVGGPSRSRRRSTPSRRSAQGDEWQSAQLAQAPRRPRRPGVHRRVTESPSSLGLGDIRSILEDRLRGRPTRANFRTGHLTVCTLVPMRSVPHRVVCLLGLDDGAFPRNPERDGDDLILADPRYRRSRRQERGPPARPRCPARRDGAPRHHLHRSRRAEQPRRPPAVPVGELLDVIDGTVRTAGDEAPASATVVVITPFSPSTPGTSSAGSSMESGSVELRQGEPRRRALGCPPRIRPRIRARFLPVPLEPIDDALVDLSDLEHFLRFPVRAFLRRRLGVNLSDRPRRVEDSLAGRARRPREVGVRRTGCSSSCSPAADIDACLAAERARGMLPPGSLCDPMIDRRASRPRGAGRSGIG